MRGQTATFVLPHTASMYRPPCTAIMYRLQVLQRMGYLERDQSVTMKGRVACEINSGEHASSRDWCEEDQGAYWHCCAAGMPSLHLTQRRAGLFFQEGVGWQGAHFRWRDAIPISRPLPLLFLLANEQATSWRPRHGASCFPDGRHPPHPPCPHKPTPYFPVLQATSWLPRS